LAYRPSALPPHRHVAVVQLLGAGAGEGAGEATGAGDGEATGAGDGEGEATGAGEGEATGAGAGAGDEDGAGELGQSTEAAQSHALSVMEKRRPVGLLFFVIG
jgi:hypothetical protein